MKYLLTILIVLLAVTAHASVDTISVFSKAMNKTIKVVIVKPNELSENKKIPTVYLLHGHGANYKQWIAEAPQIEKTSNAMKALLILPDGGYSSWYLDSEIDSSFKYETFIINELIPYIDANYPTINNRNARAITGLSMGGHGALYLSIKHKNLFGAAGSVCGGVDIRPFPKNWDITKILGTIEANPSNWEKNSVINVSDSLENGDLQLIIDCGLDDFFLNVNRSLHKKLLDKKIAHTYTERPGKHNTAYWRNSIDYQLLFFKNYFDENK